MGLFPRRGHKKERSVPSPAPDSAPPEEQPTPGSGENPLAAAMPWLQTAGSPLSLGDTAPTPQPPPEAEAQASPSPAQAPSGQAADAPAPKPPEGNGNGLSEDLRSLFTSDGPADPEMQALASSLDDVDVHQLATLAKEVASLVRR